MQKKTFLNSIEFGTNRQTSCYFIIRIDILLCKNIKEHRIFFVTHVFFYFVEKFKIFFCSFSYTGEFFSWVNIYYVLFINNFSIIKAFSILFAFIFGFS